jgi:hypothetical protein
LKEIPDLEKLSKSDSASAEHANDFAPSLYNIWKQEEKTAGSSHFSKTAGLRCPRDRSRRRVYQKKTPVSF